MAREPLRIIVAGAAGRMGSRVSALASADARFFVVARVAHKRPLEPHGPPSITLSEVSGKLSHADAVVDFSAPAASLSLARAAAAARKPIVVGTTGWKSADLSSLKSLSRKTPIFLAPNFSRGVAVLMKLAELACRSLPDFAAAIVETHHDQKKDAPSGTALKLAAATGRGKVPTVSQRIGGVVGDHTLTLAGATERLELTHRADSRDVFARGALDAVLWLKGRRPGLYGMSDLLGLA